MKRRMSTTLGTRMRACLPATLVLTAFTLRSATAGAGARPENSATEPFAPASLYKAMFDLNREWRFQVESISEDRDPDDPRSKNGVLRKVVPGSASCRVTKVVRWSSSLGSRIECTGPLSRGHVQDVIPAAGGFLDGDWVATAHGLWRFDVPVLDGSEPAVVREDMIIAARPTRTQSETATGDGGDFTSVRKERNAWCVTRGSWSGDEFGYTFCWASPAGLQTGRRYVSGGRYVELRICVGDRCRMPSKTPQLARPR